MKWNKHCDKSNISYNLCNMYTGKINGYANYHCLKCNSDGPLKLKPSACFSTGRYRGPPFVSWSLLISTKEFNILQVNNPERNAMRSYYSQFEPVEGKMEIKERVYLHNDTNAVIDSKVVTPSFDNCLQTRNLTFVISYANNKSVQI